MKKLPYKKILYGFLVFVFGIFFGGIVSFCSADGIYSSGGLISIVYNDNTNTITLQDRNLGATCNNPSSDCSYGYYFQWGNNYGFSVDPLNYSESQSNFPDLTSYGPGNYFNSNGVLYSSHDSNAVFNYNLWGGVDGTLEAMQGPCPDGFHVIDNWQNFSGVVNSLGLTFNGNLLKNYFYFPDAGYLYNGHIDSAGYIGWYWASTSSVSFKGNRIEFTTSNWFSTNPSDSYWPASVRCFKNEAVSPDYTWNKIYGDTIVQPITIDVFYDYNNSFETIVCNGDNAIHINSLANYNNGVFTPYFNIFYSDQDSQVLTESYSKELLVLNGKYTKTYTGGNENYWVLTPEGVSSDSMFTGYVPHFDVTGSTNVLNNDNVFNNFADNSLKVLLSNIPSYIQYVTIFLILLFLFGFIRRFKRKR